MINKLLKEIENLNYILKNTSLSPQDTQRINDEIIDKKRQIESLSKKEMLIIPMEASTISERKNIKRSAFSENSVRLF